MGASSAIYHLHYRNVSRTTSSATASLAYMIGQPLKSVYDGEVKRPGIKRAHRVLKSEIMLPDTAPAEWQSKGFEFIAAKVELAEKAKNAQPAASMDVALPRGMSWEEREQIVREFIAKNFTENNYIACYALHDDGIDQNPHAHIWIGKRQLGAKGFLPKFKSEYALDENGNKIPVIDPKTGKQKIGARNQKQWKRIKVSRSMFDEQDFIPRLRASWADTLNAHLAPEMHVSEKSNRAQGKSESPTIHDGWEAEQMGTRSERVRENLEIKQENHEIQSDRAQLRELDKKIHHLVLLQIRKRLIAPIVRVMDSLKLQIEEIRSGKNESLTAADLRASLNRARHSFDELQQASFFHRLSAQREFESAWRDLYQQIPSTLNPLVRAQIPVQPPLSFDDFDRWEWLEATLLEQVKTDQIQPLQQQWEAQRDKALTYPVDKNLVASKVALLDVENPLQRIKDRFGRVLIVSKRLLEIITGKRSQPVSEPVQAMPEPVQKPIQQPSEPDSEPMPVLGKAGINSLIQQRLQQAQQAEQKPPQQPQQTIKRRHIRR